MRPRASLSYAAPYGHSLAETHPNPFENRKCGNIQIMSNELLTVAEVAEMLDVSKDTIRRMFAAEFGVINIGRKQNHDDRRYRILRIPRRVLDRVIAERSIGREVAAELTNPPTKPL